MKKGVKGLRLAILLLAGGSLTGACEETPNHKRESLGPGTAQNAKAEDLEAEPVNGGKPDLPSAPPPDAPALNGKQLYADLCATCHGALEQAEHAGKDAAAIKNAINTVPDMSGLKDLSDAKIAVIGGELVKIVPPPANNNGGAQLDGMKLYMDNCMGCHGPKPNTTVDVKTVDAVKAARVNVPEMAGNATPDNELMALLKYLTDP